MTRWILAAGCAAGLLAVAAGAFGAHALRPRLDVRTLETFQVAVRYQMFHALALLAAGWLAAAGRSPWAARAAVLFALGTVLFSGSLYVVALTELRWMGAVTPLGGAALLAGWLCLGVAGWRHPEETR